MLQLKSIKKLLFSVYLTNVQTLPYRLPGRTFLVRSLDTLVDVGVGADPPVHQAARRLVGRVPRLGGVVGGRVAHALGHHAALLVRHLDS